MITSNSKGDFVIQTSYLNLFYDYYSSFSPSSSSYYYYNYMWVLFSVTVVVIAPAGFAKVSVSSRTLQGIQEGLKRENNSNHPQHSGAKCCQFTGLTMECFQAKSQQEVNKQLIDLGHYCTVLPERPYLASINKC